MDSVKIQQFGYFEHVIIDDGSTDDLDSIIYEYAKEVCYPIKYIKKENGGKHTAINAFLDVMEGDFFVRLDSDDELTPDCLKNLYNGWLSIPIAERNDYWCVFGREIDQNGNLIGKEYPKDINEIDYSLALQFEADNVGDKLALIRRETISDERFPEPKEVKFVTENVFWRRFYNRYKIWFTNDVCYIYYIAQEVSTLTKRIHDQQFYSDEAWYYKWQLTHSDLYNAGLRESIKYSFSYCLSSDKYKKCNGYIDGFSFVQAILQVLLFIPSIVCCKLYKKKKG